jgi:hypothetical protein
MSIILFRVTTMQKASTGKRIKCVVFIFSSYLHPLNCVVQQLQGTLQVTLRNSPSSQSIDDNEVRRKFQQFGDVKSVHPVGDRPELSISQLLSGS